VAVGAHLAFPLVSSSTWFRRRWRAPSTVARRTPTP